MKDLYIYLEQESQILNALSPCVSLLLNAISKQPDSVQNIVISQRDGSTLLDYLKTINEKVSEIELKNSEFKHK